jgi:hypothetical protein
LRVSRSVDAHIADLERTRAELADYPAGHRSQDVSGKFSDPLAFVIEPPLK